IFLELSGRMLFGTEIPSMLVTLEALPVDVIGMNCSTGPEHMRDAIRYLCAHARRPISCIPNAGLPLRDANGDTIFPIEPEPFAGIVGELVHDLGVSVVGGCCGTRPAHIAKLREVVGYGPRGRPAFEYEPYVSSGMGAMALQQDPRPLIVGERVNSLGSRKV